MNRLNDLAAFLKAHDDYAVLGHINPDGDTSGSCIALCLALKAMGKRAFVYLPGGLAKMYTCFERSVEIVSGKEFPYQPKTAFSVDVSDIQRLGEGREIFEACEHQVVIDHHSTNTGFGEVCFVDGHAASCGELAVELIRELGVELSTEMATWLYVAICTDCGRFGFSSTRPETMEAAADCLRAGIDVDMIHRELYRTRSEGRTRLLGLVLSGLEMNDEKTMAWARLTDDMLQKAHALREDNEGVVNYLVEIEGVQFACLAEERGENVTKFSLRSKPGFDAAANVAVPLGGGGHACAAGVTLNMPMEEALNLVLEKASNALK